MRVLLSWLLEYCPIDKSPDEIARDLTKAGIEVDHVEEIRPAFQGVIACRIEKIEKLSPSHNCVTLFDGTKTVQVVSTASNLYEKMLSAYAPVGSTMPDGSVVEEKVIEGIQSPGFLCSEKELALSGCENAVITLDDDVSPGTDLAKYFSDTCFDVTITPNLGHCQSVLGIARELAAFSGVSLVKKPWLEQEPFEGVVEDKNLLDCVVDDADACPRYSALKVENVTIESSSTNFRVRLERSGIRSINNVVDITNYVSHALGQPLHAFDADCVDSQKIIVRKSLPNETLVFLDDVERTLPENTIVIADPKKPLACAGVMGGSSSAVSESTKKIIFESAFFHQKQVARASRLMSLQTDSSKRFERGCDQNITNIALGLAYSLLHKMNPKACLLAKCDIGQKRKSRTLSCRLSRASKILGYEVSVDEVESALTKLYMSVSFDGKDRFSVEVPSYRHDLNEEIDLIEEIAKLVGFEASVVKKSRYTSSEMPHHPLYTFRKEVTSRLVSLGLAECLTCDLISPEMASLVCDDPVKKDALVHMLNPLSVSQSVLRPSLLSGMVDSLARNISHRTLDFHAFEIGHVHLKKETTYEEPLCFAVMLSGQKNTPHFSEKNREVDFFDLKGILEVFFSSLGFSNFSLEKSTLSIFHPGRQAKIYIAEHHVGMIGELHPKLLRSLGIEQRVYFSECDLQELLQIPRKEKMMEKLAEYPQSDRDWTITLAKSIPFDMLMKKIDEVRPAILESVSLVSIFEHEKLGTDVHNVTIHFVYRDREKTVSQQEVDAAHTKIVSHVGSLL